MAETQSVKPEATKEQLQEKEKNKEKKEDTPAPQQIEWEFAIKFTKLAKPSQISYLNTVLKEGGFTTLYLQKEKNEGEAKTKEGQEDDQPFLLLKMGDDEVVLSHAEGMRRALKIFADQEVLDKRMKEKTYLPEEVLKAEMKEDFEYKRKDQFDTDIEEGERARVMRFIIYTLKPKKEGIDVIADLGMLQGETIMALYLRKKLVEDCIIFHTDTAKQLVKKTL